MTNTSAIKAALDKPFALMGIVNVTPDSFYDGGRYRSTDAAVQQGIRLLEQGADILDIGGASSRPGAKGISPEEECRRILPVIEQLYKESGAILSVDTTWAPVARAALDAGVSCVNDISAGRFDPLMAGLIAERDCTVVLMHSRGTPQTMQTNPHYGDVCVEVRQELLESAMQFMEAGTKRERIILDPGIGFAKTAQHNLELLRRIDCLVATGFPVLLGSSRKSFVGQITGKPVEKRLTGSLGSVAYAFMRGVKLFRVHDVDETNDFLKVLSAIENRQNAP